MFGKDRINRGISKVFVAALLMPIFCAFFLPLNAMDEEDKSYSLSLSKLCKKAFRTKLAKNVILGVGTFGATIIGQKIFCDKVDYKWGVGTGVSVFALKGMYDKFIYKPPFLDQVLTNPSKALNRAERVGDSINNKLQVWIKKNIANPEEVEKSTVKELKALTAKHLKLLKKYPNECPSLGECTKEDWWPCLLSRHVRPQLRQAFEQEVVKVLSQKIQKNSDKKVTCVGFGVGGMFQDLVIAAKTLTKNPHASLTMHLIDPKFTPLAAYFELKSKNEPIDVTGTLDEKTLKKMVPIARSQWGVPSTMEDEQVKELVRARTLEPFYRCSEFVLSLKKHFPQEKIKLFVHPKADCYIRHVKEEKSKSQESGSGGRRGKTGWYS